MEPSETGRDCYGPRYTEEKLSDMEKIDKNIQLVLERLADQKKHHFGRTSERHAAEGRSRLEADEEIIFFNEPAAVADEEAENENRKRPGTGLPKRKKRNVLKLLLDANLLLTLILLMMPSTASSNLLHDPYTCLSLYLGFCF